MILFDKLSYSSPVRQTSPALKSLFAVGSLVICVSFRQVSVCVLVLCCMAACTLQFANVTPRRYLRFLLGPLVFLALSSVAVLFFVSSSPQELFSFRLFSRYIGISRLSFSNWYSLMAVAFSGVSCLYFLILTTPVTDLLAVLRRLHCPWLLLELMLLIYRAIFVLLDIASAIQTAQNCRLGNRTFRSKLSCMGQMLSVLLVRSLKSPRYCMMRWKAGCTTAKSRCWKKLNQPDLWLGLPAAAGLSFAPFCVFCCHKSEGGLFDERYSHAGARPVLPL